MTEWWERYTLFIVWMTALQTTSRYYFFKINVNSGFWQILLATRSRHLKTFKPLLDSFVLTSSCSGSQVLKSCINIIWAKYFWVGWSSLSHRWCPKSMQLHLQSMRHNWQLYWTSWQLPRLRWIMTSVNSTRTIYSSWDTSLTEVASTTALTRSLLSWSLTNILELRRFLGMANQLGKFVPLQPYSASQRATEHLSGLKIGSRSATLFWTSISRTNTVYYSLPTALKLQQRCQQILHPMV